MADIFGAATSFVRALHQEGLITFASWPRGERVVTMGREGDYGAGLIAFNERQRAGTSVWIAQAAVPIHCMPGPGDVAASRYVGIHMEDGIFEAEKALTSFPKATILLSAGRDVFAVWRLDKPVSGKDAVIIGERICGHLGGRLALFVPLPGTHRGREIVKQEHILKHLAYDPSAFKPKSREKPKLLNADEVTAKPLEWLWPNLLPLGAITLLGGRGGIGKSQTGIDIAARVSTGRPWPTGESGQVGNVIVWEVEDDIERTTVPRLIAAGADMSRVKVTADHSDLGNGGFEDLVSLIEGIGGVRMVMLSPFRKFFEQADPQGNLAVRKAMQPLVDYASSRQMTFLGIMHPPKDKEDREAFGGPGAYFDLSRAALSCIHDPEDRKKPLAQRRRIIVSAKGNLGPDTGILRYTTVGVSLPGGLHVSRIDWLDARADEPRTQGGHRTLALPKPRPPPTEWLKDRLSNGPVPAAVVEEEAFAIGYGKSTLYNAAAAIGVLHSKTKTYPARATWELPW